MHRMILGVSDPSVCVDHINLNKRDNRRSNLRLATRAENSRNRVPSRSNTTGFKGVTYRKKKKLYRARIRAFGLEIYLGSFKCPIDAAAAYDKAAIEYYGEFAMTNEMLGFFEVKNNKRERER